MAKTPSATEAGRPARLTADQVHAVVGDIDPVKMSAIIATGGTLADLVEAAALVEGEREIMGESPRPLTGSVAAICDILSADRDLEEPD